MKKIVTFFFAVCFTVLSFAQKTLSGKILDDDGQPLASASVTVEEPGKDAIIAYGISNSKGEYKVAFTSGEAKVDVKVKAFNHKTLVKQVTNETQSMNFSLQGEATEIKEIKLKSKLITKRGDTISYDISEFDNKADRTLSDVLKKLPGIEVNATGQILYQGEPINKFYVNGKDLMEGGYGTIVNSLPKDAVQKMEVLENHQPVRVLQDKVPSENAAINIKLKNKVTMTGRGEVGAGLSPFLWNMKLTPMFFGQKNQWVINYKANNTGEAVESERNILAFGSRWEGRRSQASQNNWVSVEKAQNPNVPEKRYLLNNVHYISANLLTNPFKNKEWELKLNANYANNAVERESFTEITYDATPSNPSPNHLITRLKNNLYSNAAKGEMIFTKNAKKGFFKNTTTWNGFWNEDRGSLLSDFSMRQSLSSPTGSFTNSLSTIIPWKEKMINFMSYVGYQKDTQNLASSNNNYFALDNLFDGRHFDRFDQNLNIKKLEANHSASVGFSHKSWTITPEVGINLSFNGMDSKIYGNQQLLETPYQNDMRWNEINPYTQVGLSYKNQGINLNITLPMNFYGMDYKDLLRNKNTELSKTVFEPSFFANYEFASFWKIWAFGNINYFFGNFGSVYEGNIFNNPRSLGNNNDILPENRAMNASTRLEYRNPLNNLFFNVRYGFNSTKKNLISKSTRDLATGTTRFGIEYFDNTPTSNNIGAEIGKYFPKFKSNLSFTFGNKDSNAFNYVVDPERNINGTVENKINGQNLGFKFNNTYFSWMSVDYNLSMNWSKVQNLLQNTEIKTSGWSHNLATYFYPSENHTVGFFWDDMTYAQGKESRRNKFFDVSYQYTWAKKKIDFELKWLNIGNHKFYETISYNPDYLFTIRNSINIRPSQFLFTVKFNFK